MGLMLTLLQAAELKHISMGNFEYSLITDSYDAYDSKGEVMKLYAEENNNDLTFILSLTLHDKTGTCSDKSLEDGSYEINGTTLTLYSAWDRLGRAYDAPVGARIQVYELQPNATFKRISSRLYIETHRKKQDQNSGMQYLFSPPKNKKEQKAFEAYIEEVETRFKGTFVFGEEAKQLRLEVQEALRRKMQTAWH
ncbi:MAG: hypothetical protein B7X69_05090 [Sulfurovum sp. 39-42-12]|jgi:hypothetical protein|nr:MAG: hypothetical protein B7Y63_04035 [Sulfurovum sp. 35-42-20]OYZ26681.1 MAG: hypothetical protein B7Y23_01465 [Sulfurovum sp. 16-42-52]OYZ49355.1 MAG: hypothetical protein B7Y13_04895 [Sulfurovum sp. 24-42-9]OZA60102.1 MAG: hypothetical protein B7X69_05090 [Sulfurovum sp. 39-42-12]